MLHKNKYKNLFLTDDDQRTLIQTVNKLNITKIIKISLLILI